MGTCDKKGWEGSCCELFASTSHSVQWGGQAFVPGLQACPTSRHCKETLLATEFMYENFMVELQIQESKGGLGVGEDSVVRALATKL